VQENSLLGNLDAGIRAGVPERSQLITMDSRGKGRQGTLLGLRMTIADRHPGQGVAHHSYQGVQYASVEYVEELRCYGFVTSIGSNRQSLRDAMMGRFFKTLKYEEVYLSEYETFEDVLRGLHYLIEEVYNQKNSIWHWGGNHQMTLRGCSPFTRTKRNPAKAS